MATLPFYRQTATPLAYELMYVYVAGSSVLADIYSDHTLTTARTNPMQANGAGLFGPLFVKPGVKYDVKYRTSDGTQRDTYEGIEAANSSIPAANSSSNGYLFYDSTTNTYSWTTGTLGLTATGFVHYDAVSGSYSVTDFTPWQVKTSVNDSVPGYLASKFTNNSFLTFSESIDSSGKGAIDVSLGTLGVKYGGTGLSSLTANSLVYASGVEAFSSIKNTSTEIKAVTQTYGHALAFSSIITSIESSDGKIGVAIDTNSGRAYLTLQSSSSPYTSVTAPTYTASLSDNMLVCYPACGVQTITLPDPSPYGGIEKTIWVFNQDAASTDLTLTGTGVYGQTTVRPGEWVACRYVPNYGATNSTWHCGTMYALEPPTVTLNSHGFSVGEPVRLDVDSSGNQMWSSAYATDDLSHTATHYIVSVPTSDTFVAANSGFWAITPSTSVYGQQFLGATAGTVVNSISSLPSQVAIQPLGILDSTGLHINITSYVRDLTP